VAVPYRDYWFWIDDRDVPSKAMFSFLMFVFTLTETGGKNATPVITIPAGYSLLRKQALVLNDKQTIRSVLTMTQVPPSEYFE
jgi:hypothetical protein